MMKLAAVALAAAAVLQGALADVYLHYPRSSNNRLNEQSADRNNGDRLFDSQNNNRGGYNVGEKTATTFTQDITAAFQSPENTFSTTSPMAAMQYQQVYFEGSQLIVEYTNQHACGGNEQDDPQKINCNIVLQYMCDTDATTVDKAMTVVLRDGINTQTPDEPNTYSDVSANNAARGHHESESYYYECKTRSRNYGLFHADQNLNGNTARFTRQDNNGDRQGLECDEERDYYPYWTPSPWIDFAYITDDITRCPYILAGSQNLVSTWKCTGADLTTDPTDTQLNPIDAVSCGIAKGTWTEYLKKTNVAPACVAAPWSRDNHLGNGRDGQANSYNWTLPTVASVTGAKHFTFTAAGATQTMLRCVMRLRYNISTDDYNPWSINSTWDNNPAKGIVSPVQENPTVDVGADLQGLRLAINTAQFGRTFQDRTHVFYIRQRVGIPATTKIVNLSVRGKRGNIVQTYPSVEYDFIPNRLHVSPSDLIHLQWTGSNTHNNGNPGGDGQTGDAGEGTGGTDRHNFVQMLNKDDNYPMPLDKYIGTHIFDKSACYDQNFTPITSLNCAVLLATSGQYRSAGEATGATTNFDPLLNTAPPSLVGGILLKVSAGEYNYMCTRNNNFSNRSQKGVIISA